MDSIRDCGLCISLPLAKESFSENWISNNHDFSRSLVSRSSLSGIEQSWKLYQKGLAQIHRVVNQSKSLGVNVYLNATRKDIADACRTNRIVTVFAHSLKKSVVAETEVDSSHGDVNAKDSCYKIEAYDGLYPLDVFFEGFSPSFLNNGILDLAICESVEMLNYVKKRGTVTVIGSKKSSELAVRAILYLSTIRLLPETQSYLESTRLVRSI